MKIRIVAEKFSLDSAVGIERYSYELANGLESQNYDCVRMAANPSRRRFSLALNAFFKLPTKVFFGRNPSLYHATDPSSAIALHMATVPTVSTVHDLLHFHDKGFTGRIARLAYRAAARCDKVIAVSQQTKEDLIEMMNVEPSKIAVTNEGVADSFHVSRNLKKKTLIAHVGDINPRKRLELVLEIFAKLQKLIPEVTLEFVGSPVASYLIPYQSKLVKMAFQNGIKEVAFSGRVSEQVLVEKYNRIGILLVTSITEGFCFPILEAQKCGTAVVILKDCRISPEVKTATIIAKDIEDAIHICYRLIVDEDYYRKVALNGIACAKMFTWENCIEQTIEVYKEVLAR